MASHNRSTDKGLIHTKGYAAWDTSGLLKPYSFTRRSPTAHDVVIKIQSCGICHTDLHMVKGDWGAPKFFPLVPGHEIAGYVEKVGDKVTKFAVGNKVGVGCLIDSCGRCEDCKAKEESYCIEGGGVLTYGSVDKYGEQTAGGYSDRIVVNEDFVLRIPDNLDLAGAAPLLCAGITTYSPLRNWGVKPGSKVGVAGLGGLGHMGVKLAVAMGAEVTVISTSEKKRADAERLGATHFLLVSESSAMRNYFDLILDTISAKHDVNEYASLLRRDGVICLLGGVAEPLQFSAFTLLTRRRSIAGSAIGSIKQTQEMLDFCGQHNITCDVELVDPKDMNQAWDRLARNDVKYRFVIDITKLT